MALKKELRWTRIFLGCLFILCWFGYRSTNDDYIRYKDNVIDLKEQNTYLTDSTIYIYDKILRHNFSKDNLN